MYKPGIIGTAETDTSVLFLYYWVSENILRRGFEEPKNSKTHSELDTYPFTTFHDKLEKLNRHTIHLGQVYVSVKDQEIMQLFFASESLLEVTN